MVRQTTATGWSRREALTRSQRCKPEGNCGKNKHIPWESSRTITGLKLATQVTANGTQVSYKTQYICRQVGHCVYPPGRCQPVLRRLGAQPTQLTEVELLFTEPMDQGIVKRLATATILSDHTFKYGQDTQSVSWIAAASVDLLFQLGPRWAARMVVEAVERDWHSSYTGRREHLLCARNHKSRAPNPERMHRSRVSLEKNSYAQVALKLSSPLTEL